MAPRKVQKPFSPTQLLLRNQTGFSASKLNKQGKQRKSRWNSLGKTGLLFGSFNPIHKAHLQLAMQAVEKAGLKQITLILSPQNPFKKDTYLAPYQDRAAMIEIALQEKPYSAWPIAFSDIEKETSPPNYSYKTLGKLYHRRALPSSRIAAVQNTFQNRFQTTLQRSQNFVLIFGEDLLSQFASWKNAVWIAQHFNILVFRRKTLGPAQPLQTLNLLARDRARRKTVSRSYTKRNPYPFLHSKILSNNTFLEPSGAAIRKLCFEFAKQSKAESKKEILDKLQDFLCPTVLQYIQKNKLYQISQ